jgi:AbrB family looped-hinge helix DNA binding protein
VSVLRFIDRSLPRRTSMARTRVSPKYQVVIPREIREGLSLRPGQEMQMIRKGNIIILVPEQPISAYRGVLRGVREKSDRNL